MLNLSVEVVFPVVDAATQTGKKIMPARFTDRVHKPQKWMLGMYCRGNYSLVGDACCTVRVLTLLSGCLVSVFALPYCSAGDTFPL